ncbi:helix-turn-helix domain-containing protein (plasmid) [Brevundimonas staleyi]|uniref:Helix-turn-helix domain-containing protein n=1 Tax=Brevundimonas staleyi TaxID=74326 RepID=A0ABW0FNR9_9CAUL
MQRRWVVSPDYRTAIEAIQQARVGQDLSQQALATRLKKPRSFINKIENLERRLDILEFIAIAKALGLDPRDLIDRVTKALPDSFDL